MMSVPAAALAALAVMATPAHAQTADQAPPVERDMFGRPLNQSDDGQGEDMSSMKDMRMDHGDDQDHAMPDMKGMTMGGSGHEGHDMPTDHSAHQDHDISAMPGMAMPNSSGGSGRSGTDQAPGNASAPAGQPGLLSDRFYGAQTMARAHEAMMRGHGRGTYHQFMINIAEYQAREGHDGYRWDAEAWFGDLDRLVIKTQGEGTFHDKADAAEAQALYSKALDPWWNLQLGVRHDFQPSPARTYATVGIEGLAPYLFELNGALFLSDKGDLLGRIEGSYDERITQRLILQPRLELNLAAQDVPENEIGFGLNDAELGLRLRYEFSPKFAPYLGVSWSWKAGRSADYAQLAGRDVSEANVVFGLRTWF